MTVDDGKNRSAADEPRVPRRRGARSRRRLRLVVLVATTTVVVATSALVARAWYRARRIADSRREGLALLAEDRFAEALPLLSYAARDVSDVDAVIALGEARRRVPERERQHLRTAAAYFGAALRASPDELRALRPLLECLIELGYLSEVSEVAKRILALDPSDVRAREAILETEVLQGRWTEAGATARELQRLEPDRVRWRAAELRCLRNAGASGPERLELIRGWRSEQPESGGLALLECDALREVGRNSEARSLLESLAGRGVDDLETLRALLESLDATGLARLGERAIEASRVRLPTPDSALLLEAERRMMAGRIDGLEELLASGDGGEPGRRSEVVRLRVGAVYLLDGLDGAVRAMKLLATADELRDDALLGAMGLSSPRERAEAVKASFGIRPSEPLPALVAADAMLSLGETEEALSLLAFAFEASGERSQPLGLRLVRGASAAGRHPQALAAARALALRYPSDGVVAVALCDAWARALSGGLEEGVPEMQRGLVPEEALLRFWQAIGSPVGAAPGVAQALAAVGRREDAVKVLREVAGEDGVPTELGEASLLACHEAALGVDPALAARLEEEIRGRAEDVSIVIALSARLEDLGRTEAAREVLEDWIERRPDAPASERARASRWIERLGIDREAGVATLRAMLEEDASAETAALVLASDAAWSDRGLVTTAIDAMRKNLGEQSLRVAVAQGVAALVFDARDPALLAAAISELDAASRRAPDSVSVLVTLAKLLRSASPPNDAEAAGLLRRAVQVQPGDLTSYPELVSVLQQLGDYVSAERVIESYIRLAGAEIGAERRAARMQEQQGRFIEAEALHERIAGRTREAVDRLALARIRQRLGRADEARSLLAGLLGEGEVALALPELVQLEARESGLDAARATLVDRGAGVDELVRLAVEADLESQFGDLESALRSARELAERAPTAPNHLRHSRIAIREGSLEEAREALVRAIELSPDDPAALPLAGAILLGDPEGRRRLEELLRRMDDGRSDIVEAIRVLDGAMGPDGGIVATAPVLRAARDLTLRFPTSPLAWRIQVELLRLSGDERGAALAARTALSRIPGDPAIARLATEAAFAAGEPEEALAAAGGWRRLGGGEMLEADAARALVFLAQGQIRRARETLAPHRQELLARPRSAAALRALVLVELAGGGAEALAADLGPLDERALEQRATVLSAWFEAVRLVEAAEAERALVAVGPILGASEAGLAGVVAAATALCAEGGRAPCDLAAAFLDRLPPEHFARRLLDADLRAASGDDSVADRDYESIYGEAVGPEAPALLRYLREGDGAIVIEALAPQLVASPEAIAALGNHAGRILDRGGDAGRAVRLAELALAAAPGAESLRITCARALVAARDPARALAVLGGDSPTPESATMRAEALLAMGLRSDARAALTRALTLGSRSVGLPRETRRRIAELERALDAPGAGAQGG